MKNNLTIQERRRRQGVLAQATFEGFRSGRGDEVAILCHGCRRPMLILRPAGMSGITRCVPCGIIKFLGNHE
jgi:hypothetical protein